MRFRLVIQCSARTVNRARGFASFSAENARAFLLRYGETLDHQHTAGWLAGGGPLDEIHEKRDTIPSRKFLQSRL